MISISQWMKLHYRVNRPRRIKKAYKNYRVVFVLNATKLYLKIAKEEFDFQHERLKKLLDDFPSDKGEIPSTQVNTDGGDDDNIESLVDDEDNQVFTQRPRPLLQQQQKEDNRKVICKGSELFTIYIEIALKRALLETEREVLFLVERGVKETPFVIQEARDFNPVLRKDFVLQA